MTHKKENPSILITGGANGLGLSMVELFLDKNYDVLVIDYDETATNKLPKNVNSLCVDLCDFDQVNKRVGEFLDNHGVPNHLVNNAGAIHSEPLINFFKPNEMRHSFKNFKRIIDFNLNSVFFLTSVIAERMVKKRIKGSITNISSISARGRIGQSAYASSKAGVEALTKVWSKELAPLGIRVNAISPGFIKISSTENAIDNSVSSEVIKSTPLKRMGEPEHISKSVEFLVSNGFVNGEVLGINGGLVI